MSTYLTGNPVPSVDVRDLYDNAQNMDTALNSTASTWADRLGASRLTYAGMEQSFQAAQTAREDAFQDFLSNAGWEILGPYATGIEITAYNQVVVEGGAYYSLDPSVSLPYTTTDWATDEPNFRIQQLDAALRAELEDIADPDLGAALIGRAVVVVDSIKDMLNSSLSGRTDIVIRVRAYWPGIAQTVGGGEFVWLASPKSNHDGGVRISPTVPWDGTQANHAAFLAASGETNPGGSGYWLRVTTGAARSPVYYGASTASVVPDNNYIFTHFESKFPGVDADLGGLTIRVTSYPSGARYFNGSFSRISDSKVIEPGWSDTVRVANRNAIIGRETATNLTTNNHEQTGGNGYNLTILGDKAGRSAGNNLKHFTAIGPGAGYSQQYGRYNIYIGLEAGYSCTGDAGDEDVGSRNVVVGDNGARFNQGDQNIAIGRNAMQCNTSGRQNVYIGSASGGGIGPVGLDGLTIQNPFPTTGILKTAVGTLSLNWAYGNDVVGLGAQALENLKGGTGNCAVGSRALRLLESTYSPKGTAVSTTGNGAKTWTRSGTTVTVSDTAHTKAIGNVVGLTFTSGVPSNVDGVTQYVTVASVAANSWTFTVSAGAAVAMSASGNATQVEFYLNAVLATQDNNTAVGQQAGQSLLTAQETTLVGQAAGFNLTNATQVTAIGRSSLRFMVSGANATDLTNCTGVGYNARVSGNNQLQLGDTSTTVYAQAAVQTRSDRRDKDDISDDGLGIEFLLGLRPVEYRWHMRDDYIVSNEDGTVTILERDGSKKRKRLHQGFIAQEVQELCNRLGVDFAGLQHHQVNGGDDVYSLGYEEFIAPTVKAVQQCWARLDDIEKRLSGLEAKQ